MTLHSRLGTSGSTNAFTLIEMLVVVAIVSVLMAILIPSIGAIRQRARVAQVTSDFSAISRAMEEFKGDVGWYPPKPNPTRTIPAAASRHNIDIWYYLVSRDWNGNGTVDSSEEKHTVYLDFPSEKFDSSHLLIDPWGNAYGMLLPSDPKGWSSAELGWMKPYRLWSNGPNSTTSSSDPGMDGIDDINNGGQ